MNTNILIITSIAVIAALSAALLFLYLRYRKKLKLKGEKMIEEEIGRRYVIARSLHDDVGGALSATKLLLSETDNIQKARDLIDDSIKQLRSLVNNLAPPAIRNLKLKDALEDYCHPLPNVKFSFKGVQRSIPDGVAGLIYSSAIELISNALKHAHAKKIYVTLEIFSNSVKVSVSDNGCGFDIKAKRKGAGLDNIFHKLSFLKGVMHINSVVGKGTDVSIELKI